VVDPRYITITVRYDREPKYGRSLEWIAPELKGSALTLTEDHLADPRPARTWAGLVDGPTYEQFAKAWRLPKDAPETNARTPRDDRELATDTYTLDGMNWETGNQSPIVYVSLQVTAPARPERQRRARAKPPIGPRP
jgi:hypothetical protein